jgi:hypothetical protein
MCTVRLFANASPLFLIDEDDASISGGEYVEVSISLSNDDKL